MVAGVIAMIGALGLNGLVAAMSVEGAEDTDISNVFVHQVLVSALRPGNAAMGWCARNRQGGSLARPYRRAVWVVYRSKQSYYQLLEAGGMSYHRSEKANPKRDEAQVLARREEI
jgi:hypothetical protein